MVRTLIGAVALASALLAACSGSAEQTTTTTTRAVTSTTGTTVVAGSVIFGNGSMPDSVPDSFPVPASAAVGTTLHDTDSGRTEVVLVFPAEPEAVVRYFEDNLPTAGYEITTSGAAGAAHAITFTGEGFDGELIIGVGSSNASTAALTLTPSA
jgi:hypothetical protein